MSPEEQQSILDAAMKLPTKDRVEIADRLFASVNAEEHARIEGAQYEESRRRLEAIRKGELETVDGEEIMNKLRLGQRP